MQILHFFITAALTFTTVSAVSSHHHLSQALSKRDLSVDALKNQISSFSSSSIVTELQHDVSKLQSAVSSKVKVEEVEHLASNCKGAITDFSSELKTLTTTIKTKVESTVEGASEKVNKQKFVSELKPELEKLVKNLEPTLKSTAKMAKSLSKSAQEEAVTLKAMSSILEDPLIQLKSSFEGLVTALGSSTKTFATSLVEPLQNTLTETATALDLNL